MRTALQFTLLGICAAVIAAGVLFWSAKRKALAASCAATLSSCSLAAQIHANDNGERYAASLLVMSNELSTPKILVCPAQREEKLWTNDWSQVTTSNVSYEFLASGKPATNLLEPLFRCPFHCFTVLASGRVHDATGKRVPNPKFPNE